jgi:hypothetical protein
MFHDFFLELGSGVFRFIKVNRTWFFHSSQFSNRRPGTWVKSTVLRVRREASWAKAMQAIRKSMVPVRMTSLRKRVKAAVDSVSRERTTKRAKKFTRSISFW